MDLVLALDAGTTGVRTVAYDRNAVAVEVAYRELTQYFPSPGEVEHDGPEIARLAIDTLRDVAGRVRSIGHTVVAIGITNQRETTIAFDRSNGSSKHRAIVWQDRRTAPLCDQLTVAGKLDLVRSRTGLVLDPYFSGTKMRWLLEHGALDGASQPSLATIDTYVVWILSGGVNGGVYATEPSNASRTMLMDIDTRTWSTELCSVLDVPTDMLPTILPSAGTFGYVNGAVVPELAGVPISAILGDQQAALFGQACFETGMIKATYGTGAFVLANAGVAAPAPAEGLIGTVAWDLGPFGPATYALEGAAFVAGAAIQWLRDELGVITQSSDLEPLARTVSDAGGVVFVPAFTGLGSPFWRPEARGTILGLTRGTTRAHLARAVLEAQAFQVRAITDAFGAAGIQLRELRADGGAAAMDLLLELQASNSRLRVRRSSSLEATARGAATLAGLAVGMWDSLEQLGELWSSTHSVEPSDPTVVDSGYDAWLRAAAKA